MKIALQPFRRSLSPDIAQMRQESPFRVQLARGAEWVHRRLRFDSVDQHPLETGRVQFSFIDQVGQERNRRISRISVELKLTSLTRSRISRGVVGIVSRFRGFTCTITTSRLWQL